MQENLEALKDRLDALKEAQQDAKMDAAMALDELHREMAQQAGELTAQELEQLRAAIEALREKLQNLAGEETQMLEFTPEAPESLLPEIAAKQRDLERRADKELAKTKELQKSDDYKALKQKQNKQKPQANKSRPDDPANLPEPAGDDPLNGDPPEMTTPDDGGNDPAMPEADKPEANGDEFQPAIADAPMPEAQDGNNKPDPKAPSKTASKEKPKPNAPKPNAKTPESRRDQLEQREAAKLDQLQKADESLAADQRALDELLSEIGELLNSEMAEMAEADSPMPGEPASPAQPMPPADGQPMDGQPPEGQAEQANDQPLSAEKAAELRELLQSAKAQKAMQMAARLQAMQAGDASEQPSKNQKPPNNQPPPLKSNPKPRSGLEGDNASQFAMEAILKDLDPSTRSMILKMQPRVREELLQSLREEGPEGYQRFIRDYFKRLTKAVQQAR